MDLFLLSTVDNARGLDSRIFFFMYWIVNFLSCKIMQFSANKCGILEKQGHLSASRPSTKHTQPFHKGPKNNFSLQSEVGQFLFDKTMVVPATEAAISQDVDKGGRRLSCNKVTPPPPNFFLSRAVVIKMGSNQGISAPHHQSPSCDFST